MKMKKSISLFLVMILMTVAFSQSISAADTIYTYNGYSYTDLDDGNISICGWDNSSELLMIPSTIMGDNVAEIADMSLMNNTYITSVDMSSARYLTRIGMMAFCNCTGLKGTLTVSSRISEIGIGAFQNCSGITKLNYYANNADIPNQCFYKCASLTEVHITDGVTAIGRNAFSACESLTKVRIPRSTTAINESAFNNCSDLVIYCYTDSYAHQYAVDNGYEYVLLDAPAPTEPPTDPPTDPATEPPTETATDPQTEPVTEEPSKTPVEVTFKIGDADGDGEITILDATKIQRYLVGLDKEDMIAIRGISGEENALNIIHATRIQRDVAGFESSYHIGESVTRTIYI